MTDNEVVKALECCSKDEINGLNIFTYGGVPMRSLLRYALDLINRLRAENKRLSTLAELGNTRANDYRVMRDRALKAEAENERLKRYESITSHDLPVIPPLKISKPKDEVAEIKFEAYKEFAERLKICLQGDIRYDYKILFECDIDNLLKEIIGE